MEPGANWITRDELLRALQRVLEASPPVYAAWLEGADASGHVDAYSDIDLWLDVRDGQEDAVFALVHQALASLGEVAVDYERPHPHPQIRQRFLRVVPSSPYLLVDLCLQSHSRSAEATAFVRNHDAVTVLFDKAGVVRFVDAAPREHVEQQLQALRQEFALFQRWVEKCLKRRDFLEALAAYHRYTLEPLVFVLRLRHAPFKTDYMLKHSGRDLPVAVVKRLENLYAVASLEDIASRHIHACAWFWQLLDE